MNDNPYEWTPEAIKQNALVAERDQEIALLRQRLAHFDALPPKSLLGRLEDFFLHHVVAFALGMLCGMSVLIMRWAS